MAEKSSKKPEDTKVESKKKSIHKVRILATDIDSSKKLITGISCVKGVGHNMANVLVVRLGLDRRKRLVDLSEEEIERIENAISDPAALGIPGWMFNRRRDHDTGRDIHLNTSDLTFAVREDINRMGEIKSYKGLRHTKGLKVRGQRTASTGRGSRVVGVQRKKQQPGKSK